MRIIITRHAQKRLKELRQENITAADILKATQGIPGFISTATRFRNFVSASGRMFDIVIKDTEMGRLVITIIGK